MKFRTMKWKGDIPVPNWKRNILEVNPRTHVPRIVRPTRPCRFSVTDIEAEIDILRDPEYVVSTVPFGHFLFKVTRRKTTIDI